jgi:hypothetical protein
MKVDFFVFSSAKGDKKEKPGHIEKKGLFL